MRTCRGVASHIHTLLKFCDGVRLCHGRYAAGDVIAACDAAGVAYRVELYSEAAPEGAPTTVTHFPGTGKPLQQGSFTYTRGLNSLGDFECLQPHLTRCLDQPLLATFDKMIGCDVLVASRSSLSACAAYLKPRGGLTIYHPFWHAMLTAEDGHLACDDPRRAEHVAAFVKRFGAARLAAAVSAPAPADATVAVS